MVKTALITAAIGSLAVGPIAEVVAGVEMPWPAQFGLCGLFGGMLWWHMAKTVPQILDTHERTAKGLSDQISGMRDDNRDFADKQLAMLRECLIEKRAK